MSGKAFVGEGHREGGRKEKRDTGTKSSAREEENSFFFFHTEPLFCILSADMSTAAAI